VAAPQVSVEAPVTVRTEEIAAEVQKMAVAVAELAAIVSTVAQAQLKVQDELTKVLAATALPPDPPSNFDVVFVKEGGQTTGMRIKGRKPH